MSVSEWVKSHLVKSNQVKIQRMAEDDVIGSLEVAGWMKARIGTFSWAWKSEQLPVEEVPRETVP